MKYHICFAIIVYLLHQSCLRVSAQGRVRYVDSMSGNDTGNDTCSKEMPCRTLRYAVFEDSESDRDYFNCNKSSDIAYNSTIMVEDGVYKMNGFGLVLCEVFNITIRAVNPGRAVVQCACFNCSIENAMFGNIYIQRANNVSFEGMVFEKCGYNASNVFVRSTTGLTFRNCIFR